MCHKEPKPTKHSKKNKAYEADAAYNQKDDAIPSDILGSYTGVPLDGGVPVQDADDL